MKIKWARYTKNSKLMTSEIFFYGRPQIFIKIKIRFEISPGLRFFSGKIPNTKKNFLIPVPLKNRPIQT